MKRSARSVGSSKEYPCLCCKAMLPEEDFGIKRSTIKNFDTKGNPRYYTYEQVLWECRKCVAKHIAKTSKSVRLIKGLIELYHMVEDPRIIEARLLIERVRKDIKVR